MLWFLLTLILAAFGYKMKGTQKTNQLSEKDAKVNDAIDKLGVKGTEYETPATVTAKIAGLEWCRYCKQNVSPMSKCSKNYGGYHVDWVYNKEE